MTSKEYWKKRETEHARQNKKSEQAYKAEIQKTYDYMLDQIQKEINGFYAKYAKQEKITLAEAKKRVSRLDIEEYGRKAAKYVKEKDFSDQANEEMRLYNATMKINRLELLKANIGLEMVSGFNELQKYFDRTLTEHTIEEFRRQAGILGKSVQDNGKMAQAIVDASFQNATYSDRIWMYQDMLKAELGKLLRTGLIQGRNPRELAPHLQKRFGASREDAERLIVTELARVQTEAQKQSYRRNGFEKYTYVACGNADVCDRCQALDGKHFKVEDMMPGTNAPPMHPRCHCSTAAYADSKEYEQWLDFLDKGGTTEEWERLKNIEKEESKAKYKYSETIVERKMLASPEYRRKFDMISDNTKVNRTAWQMAKEMLSHRSGSKYEDLGFIDSSTGKGLINKEYDAESKAAPNKAMKKMLDQAETGTIIAMHNHPGSSVPSIPDIRACMQRRYKEGIVICHDGKIYIYSVDAEKYNEPIAASALDRLEKRGYTKEVGTRLKDAGISLEVL